MTAPDAEKPALLRLEGTGEKFRQKGRGGEERSRDTEVKLEGQGGQA